MPAPEAPPAEPVGNGRLTTSEHVYRQLRESITGGALPGGSILSQIALAEQFGVSRVPVREALRRLQAERLLTARPFQRYVVLAPSESQVYELLAIRAELEAFALRRLAAEPERLAATLDEARSLSETMSSGEPYDSWMAKDRAFHRLLNGPGSEVARIADEARMSIQQFLRVASIPLERRLEQLVEHRGILDRLQAGDLGGAEEALRLHISHTVRQIAALIAGADGAGADGAGADGADTGR